MERVCVLCASAVARQAANRTVARQYHAGTFRFSYQMGYETIRAGSDCPDVTSSLKGLLPETVQKNVKNVVGWRGAAERGFLAVYPDLIQTLSKEGSNANQHLGSWYTKVLTHNLSSGVLGQRFGLLVPLAFRQLRASANRDEMRLAHVLGWGVELARAANAVTCDTFDVCARDQQGQQHTNGENGTSIRSWASKHALGAKAFNDAALLQSALHIMLREYFRGDEAYVHLLDAFLESQRLSALGRLLLFDSHPIRNPGLDAFTMKTYKKLVKYNVANTCYCLPIGLALHMAGLHESKNHQQMSSIFNEIAYFAEANRDFFNCFVDPKGGDIGHGRITWLAVVAKQRADAAQAAVLEECYGSPDQHNVDKVKEIYEQLNLKKIFSAHMLEKQQEISQSIQQISKLDKVGLSQEFFFKLIDNMNTQITRSNGVE